MFENLTLVLIKENLLKIIDVISYYERLSEEEFQIIETPKLFNEIKSKWHYSATQSYRLETLLRRIETFSNIILSCTGTFFSNSSLLNL